MTEQMMKEILEDWMSWKYDIWEANTSTWTVRDDSKVHMIGVILEEKLKPDSFYKPYLNILPEKQENFPQFFNKNELDQLKGSFTLEMIRSRNLSIEKEYNEIVYRVPELGEKTVLRDYIWARISIVSRIFSINLSCILHFE